MTCRLAMIALWTWLATAVCVSCSGPPPGKRVGPSSADVPSRATRTVVADDAAGPEEGVAEITARPDAPTGGPEDRPVGATVESPAGAPAGGLADVPSGGVVAPAVDAASLTDEELAARIASLRKLIVPPPGTDPARVAEVFGASRVIPELPAGGKGSRSSYPMHVHQLLPPRGRAEFRAFLYLTVRDGEVKSAGINHICVAKGRPVGRPSPELVRALRREREQVLADLEEIRAKYREQLDAAGWGP